MTLQNKRHGYAELRRELYDSSPVLAKLGLPEAQRATSCQTTPPSGISTWAWNGSEEEATLEQIRRDLPRIVVRGPHSVRLQALVDSPRIHSVMERVLFLWAVRQPAAGYVQGLHDVLLPLLLVFCADAAQKCVDDLEADSYWCLAKVLSEVVDHYTDGQPGLQRAT